MPEIDTSKISAAIDTKYTVENNTFLTTAKDVAVDKIEVEIGDSKQTDFLPQVKIQRWDNEVNFSARLIHEETAPVVSTLVDKIVWEGDKVSANFYDITEDEGGYEFEVILKEKPKTNVVSFTINTKGLDFFYQPEIEDSEVKSETKLTAEELLAKKREMRPENVVGSYAVYASENKTNYVGGKEYKCGKVGHIYRPRIEDAKGNKVWGELNVDTEKGILSVTIPQDFLDKAIYPVRHAAGLTFGYTSDGSSNYNTVANSAPYTKGIPSGGNGSVDSISVRGRNTGYSAHSKNVIWLVEDNSIITNSIGSDYGSYESVGNWYKISYVTKPNVSNGTPYFVGLVFSNIFKIYYDTGNDGDGGYDNANSFTTPEELQPADGTKKHAIYATYTAGGGTATVKTINGIVPGSVKSINGTAIASHKTLQGFSLV